MVKAEKGRFVWKRCTGKSSCLKKVKNSVPYGPENEPANQDASDEEWDASQQDRDPFAGGARRRKSRKSKKSQKSQKSKSRKSRKSKKSQKSKSRKSRK